MICPQQKDHRLELSLSFLKQCLLEYNKNELSAFIPYAILKGGLIVSES